MQPIQVVFVLPASGGGGGANSIVQEAMGLSRIGCGVGIAVNRDNYAALRRSYPELVGTNVKLESFDNTTTLGEIASRYTIVCATTALSVKLVDAAVQSLAAGTAPAVAYYVQDYEPLFYELDSPDWKEAHRSYTLMRDAQLFAKTEWIRTMVRDNHGVDVAPVVPSLDHDIYYPDLARAPANHISIVAMLRPKTKRRAPFRTTRILSWLASNYGAAVSLETFGTSSEDLASAGIALSPAIINHGRLRRSQVPAVLRRADLFLDLSDYQAFGRTAVEAMASGCTPLMPLLGGATEFARNGHDSLIVDTRSDEAIKRAIAAYIAMAADAREVMRFNGLLTSARFSIQAAVATEVALLRALLRRTSR